MKESLTLKAIFPVSPEQLYHAWLDGDTHAAMTGGAATGSAEEGVAYTAWGGYISGINKSLKAPHEIVQTWRTTEFQESDEDSLLTLQFKVVEEGCELTLIHTEIPAGQTQYKQGWIDHYFTPMKGYFG